MICVVLTIILVRSDPASALPCWICPVQCKRIGGGVREGSHYLFRSREPPWDGPTPCRRGVRGTRDPGCSSIVRPQREAHGATASCLLRTEILRAAGAASRTGNRQASYRSSLRLVRAACGGSSSPMPVFNQSVGEIRNTIGGKAADMLEIDVG